MLLPLFQVFSKIQKKVRPDKNKRTNKQTWTASQNDALIQVASTRGDSGIIFTIGTMSDGSSVMHLLLGREV